MTHDSSAPPPSVARRERASRRAVTRSEIERTGLFDQVDLSSLFGLLDRCPCFDLEPGEILTAPRDGDSRFYLVLEGRFTVHLDEDPESVAVAEIGPGESVGEMSLIDGRPASALVKAREAARVVGIDADVFWTLIQSSHEFTVNLLSLLARRLRGNNATVDESRRLQAEYRRHASVDGLTGLSNRRRLDEILPRYLARAERDEKPLSALMVDVDHFKGVNDRFGHRAGDTVLFEVAKLLRDRSRPTDFVARYGGEEFTVILPATSVTDALVVAERLRKAVEKLEIRAADGSLLPPLTISLGIAGARFGEAASDWLDRADRALYRAKRSGRNRALVASADDDVVSSDEAGVS